jgi:hypothetical protein
MSLDGSDVVTFIFIAHSSRLTWEFSKYPLYRSESTMTRELVYRIDAFGECHIQLLSADDIGLLNHLDEHPLERLVAPFDSANLLWAFQRGRIDADSLLGHSLSEHASVMKSSIGGE